MLVCHSSVVWPLRSIELKAFLQLLLKAGCYGRGTLSFTVPPTPLRHLLRRFLRMCLGSLRYFLDLWCIVCFLYQKRVFRASRRKAMHNHLEITSTNQFWNRSVRNLTNRRKSDMSVMSQKLQVRVKPSRKNMSLLLQHAFS